MKKKFVVAVAAVVMAAVMSVSAFAADGVTVSSITGDATGTATSFPASISGCNGITGSRVPLKGERRRSNNV